MVQVQNRFPDTPQWLDGHDPQHLLIFTHIPKAAGTSLTYYLGQIYGRHLGLWYKEWATPIVEGPIEALPADNARELYAFASHQPWGVHARLGQNSERSRSEIERKKIHYITTVRDPFDRVYSEWKFILSVPSNPRHDEVSEMSFREFLNSEIKSRGTDGRLNFMCRMITGNIHATFEDAISTLEEHYAAAATVDNSIALTDHLADLLGWPIKGNYERRNRTRDKSPELPQELLDCRDPEVFEDDQKLFDHVAARGLLVGKGVAGT